MKNYFQLPLILLAGLLVSCPGNGQYGGQGPGGWMPMMNNGTGYGGGIYMWIILIIVIGVGAYFYIQNQKTKGQGPTPTHNESHLDILKKRYAKGEITKEEYEKMKKELEE